MKYFPAGSIAVVGNAPGENKGHSINLCDNVIRFNNYQINGFEEQIGTKTTAWATALFKNIEYKVNQPNIVYVTLPLLDERFISGFKKYYGYIQYDYLICLIESCDVRIIPFDIWMRTGRLSTGITLLAWLYIERGFNLDHIYTFNFNFFDSTKPHHYFESKDGPAGHIGAIEKALYDRMLKGEQL